MGRQIEYRPSIRDTTALPFLRDRYGAADMALTLT